MTETEAPLPPESLTAWQPMLVLVLESFLPSGWQLIPELLLSRLPKAFLSDPLGGLPLDEEARKMYTLLLNQVEQFRKIRGEAAMKDYELAKMSLSELLLPVVERMAQEEPEKLAKMLPPEQLVKILTSDEFAKTLEALPPEVKEQIKRRLH